MSKFSVCVFCGARSGTKPSYTQCADDAGRMIATNGWRLVYGAGDVGLMGTTARSAQKHGAETLGVIPLHLMKMEVAKRDLSQFIATENMHERKKVMYMNSDAIVVLPGGAGSLDEFFEVLTWRQLGLHEKPIILISTDGYWQPLMDLMTHVVAEGFAGQNTLDYITVAETVDQAEAFLREAARKVAVE